MDVAAVLVVTEREWLERVVVVVTGVILEHMQECSLGSLECNVLIHVCQFQQTSTKNEVLFQRPAPNRCTSNLLCTEARRGSKPPPAEQSNNRGTLARAQQGTPHRGEKKGAEESNKRKTQTGARPSLARAWLTLKLRAMSANRNVV